MSQYIDGTRRDALTGTRDVVRDPSNGEVVAEITLAGPEDVDAAVERGAGGVPGLVGGDAGRAVGRAAQARRPARGRGRGAGADREPAGGQADPAGPRVRRPGHGRQHGVLRRGRPDARGAGDRGVLGRPHQLDPPRGRRRRRLDRALELPAADGRLEGPARRRRRQHDRAQAVRADPADHAAARRAGDRRRGSRTASSTSSPGPVPTAAPTCCGTRRSTWSRSPARPGSAGRSSRPRRPRPSGCTSSSAARRRSSCSTTPTSTPRSRARSPRA